MLTDYTKLISRPLAVDPAEEVAGFGGLSVLSLAAASFSAYLPISIRKRSPLWQSSRLAAAHEQKLRRHIERLHAWAHELAQ
jgi:hypothetical protein